MPSRPSIERNRRIDRLVKMMKILAKDLALSRLKSDDAQSLVLQREGFVRKPYRKAEFASAIQKDNVIGVQFHPEFSWDIIKKYVSVRSASGIIVDDPSVPESNQGQIALHNFIDLI